MIDLREKAVKLLKNLTESEKDILIENIKKRIYRLSRFSSA